MKNNKYYGFIYITKNKINGKQYIGQKKYDNRSIWKSYLGSGIAIQNAIKKYGKNNFERKIIEQCKSKKELDQKEIFWISYYDAVNNPMFYNLAIGGEGYDYFGSNKCNRSHIVYCIELERAFKNSLVASNYVEECNKTIYNKCKNYSNGLIHIKKGYHWCFIEDMYKTLNIRVNCNAKPIVCLKNEHIYGSWNHACKLLNTVYTRRSIISVNLYNRYNIKGVNVDNRLMYVSDYLKLFDATK